MAWPRDRALLGILLLAAVLRVHDVGLGDVWVDEANGILTARRSLSEIPFRLRLDSSPPLYYFVLHAWIAVFGDGQEVLRLLSAGLGVALVGACYGVGARLLSRDAGLFSAFVVATSPVHVFHSQQVRMYTLLGLLSLLSVWFLALHLRDGRWRDFWVFVATTAAALYTHNFAFHLGVVHAALIALSGRLVPWLPRWLLAAVVISAAYGPWIPTLLVQVANEDHYAWYLPLWEEYGLHGAVWRTLQSYSPAGEFVMYEYVDAPSWRGAPAIAGAVLALFGCRRVLRRGDSLGPALAWSMPLLFLLPVVSALALSIFLTPHYVPGRVDQLMYPAYALLLGAGLSGLRLPPLPLRALRTALAGAMIGFALVMKSAYYPDYRSRGFFGTDRALADAVAAELEPGDVIVCTALTRASLEYYLSRRGIDVPILNYPRGTALHLGAQNDWKLIADRAFLLDEAKAVVRQARDLAGPAGRMFLLRTNLRTNDFLAPEPLQSRFGVKRLRGMGRYRQAGTEEIIAVTVNRLRRTGE